MRIGESLDSLVLTRTKSEDLPMRTIFRLSGALAHSPPVEYWLATQAGELGEIARTWFARMMATGNDVTQVMHDGYATACVGDAAFAYVGVFKAHVNLGFFHGAALPDPTGLLEGTGKFMRHVKIKPGRVVDERSVEALITTAYQDILARLTAER